jgi:xylan 1,4-beta-xylosidase
MDSFCYWTLTDFAEEVALPADLFYGGNGMFTHNGVKKASYYPFHFANRLGDKMISKQPGCFVTRSRGKICIMLYNYEHYSDLFAEGGHLDITLSSRYAPFLKNEIVQYNLKLFNLDAKKCMIKEFFVNRENGSCFDTWVKMGAQPLEIDELNILKTTQPGLLLRSEKVNNGILNLNIQLEPHEIRLIEISLR